MVLPNAFSAILNKVFSLLLVSFKTDIGWQGTAVSEIKEFRKDFMTECAERTSCDMIATEIVCYRGDVTGPRWTDSEPGRLAV